MLAFLKQKTANKCLFFLIDFGVVPLKTYSLNADFLLAIKSF